MSERKELFLVINLGFRSIRVIVFDRNGKNLCHNWYPIKTILNGVFVEQDTNEWLKRLHQLLLEITNELPEIKENLKAITVTSSSSCLIPIDSEGKAVHNCILVSDTRAKNEAKFLADSYPEFFKENQNFLPLSSFQIPKILWIKNNDPKLFERVYKFLSPNDFLIYKLTHNICTDALNASKFYYSEEKGYPAEMFAALGLNISLFPEVKPVGFEAGKLREELKVRYGFKNDVSVIQTSYDALCAFWGSGIKDEREVNNVIGTVSSVRTISEKPLRFEANILCQKMSLFNNFVIGCSNNLDGGIFEWAKNCFYGDSYPEKYIFNIMEDEARRSGIGARGLFFIPYLLGERAPFWDEGIRGSFFGIEKFHNREDFVKSMFEASAYLLKDILDELEKGGLKIENVRLNGGLSQLDLAAQIRADVTGKKVLVLEEKESTALGAFLLLIFSLGYIKDPKEFVNFVSVKKTFIPNPAKVEIYQKLFAFFKQLRTKTSLISNDKKRLFDDLKIDNIRYEIDNM